MVFSPAAPQLRREGDGTQQTLFPAWRVLTRRHHSRETPSAAAVQSPCPFMLRPFQLSRRLCLCSAVALWGRRHQQAQLLVSCIHAGSELQRAWEGALVRCVVHIWTAFGQEGVPVGGSPGVCGLQHTLSSFPWVYPFLLLLLICYHRFQPLLRVLFAALLCSISS